MIDCLTPKERDLLQQLIDSKTRVNMLERKVERLEARLVRGRSDSKSLKHARKELANKQSEILSPEEWQAVLAMRGICES